MEIDSLFLIIGLIALVMLFMQVLQLRSIKKLLENHQTQVQVAKKNSSDETAQTMRDISGEKSTFDQFLDDHPECKLLAKSEQLKQYRKWRRDHGMTWSS